MYIVKAREVELSLEEAKKEAERISTELGIRVYIYQRVGSAESAVTEVEIKHRDADGRETEAKVVRPVEAAAEAEAVRLAAALAEEEARSRARILDVQAFDSEGGK